MKRISFFLAILLALCFGQAFAQTAAISLDPPTKGYSGVDTVRAGFLVEFPIRYALSGVPASKYSVTNAFKVYSPDGATWDGTPVGNVPVDHFGGVAFDTTGALSAGAFAFGFFATNFDNDGLDADTVAISGVGGPSGAALPDGFNAVVLKLRVLTKLADAGKHICVDSTQNFKPTNVWKWARTSGAGPATLFPTWSGPHCYTIYLVPNLPPEITNCPATIEQSHCNAWSFDFNAADNEGDPYTFELVSGPGAINAATGVWSATNIAPGMHTLQVRANDAAQGPICEVNLISNNVGPVALCPGGSVTITVGDTKTQDVNATDDCDVLTYSLIDVGGAVGVATINAATGVVEYTPDPLDGALPQPVVFIVEVSDGLLSSQCTIAWNVLTGAPYQLEIEKVHNQHQGQFADVDITLSDIDINEGLGGFNLLIAYDNSALSFNSAAPGSIYAECGWEYFTYRFGADGNCNGGCPSGLIRVVGIAETNNGANHPGCAPLFVGPLPTTLTTLKFLVTNDRTLECQYVPIRFFWIECGDNTLSNASGSKLFISDKVFDYDNAVPINNDAFGFPTYLGAQAECLTSTEKNEVVKGIDFQNGGIDIVCADSIDARGDINLNDLAYEIADAVMFTNYFVNGIGAFGTHIPGSIAASDVNADGLALTVADLVYLIRVVVGDAQPYPKVNTGVIGFHNNSGILSVDAPLAGVHVVFAGNVKPELLAENMEMIYGFDGTNTSVLVYPAFAYVNTLETFSGNFLKADGDIVSIDGATPAGAVAKLGEIPTSYALNQNYPNPFNPSTIISFALPQAGEYTLTVYNVTGQKVTEFAGNANAGMVEIEWNANGLASGVYFYKLSAGDYTATKKAVLLK